MIGKGAVSYGNDNDDDGTSSEPRIWDRRDTSIEKKKKRKEQKSWGTSSGARALGNELWGTSSYQSIWGPAGGTSFFRVFLGSFVKYQPIWGPWCRILA